MTHEMTIARPVPLAARTSAASRPIPRPHFLAEAREHVNRAVDRQAEADREDDDRRHVKRDLSPHHVCHRRDQRDEVRRYAEEPESNAPKEEGEQEGRSRRPRTSRLPSRSRHDGRLAARARVGLARERHRTPFRHRRARPRLSSPLASSRNRIVAWAPTSRSLNWTRTFLPSSVSQSLSGLGLRWLIIVTRPLTCFSLLKLLRSNGGIVGQERVGLAQNVPVAQRANDLGAERGPVSNSLDASGSSPARGSGPPRSLTSTTSSGRTPESFSSMRMVVV